MSDAWDRLAAEIELWAEEKKPLTLWWRDDDAVQPTAALNRLLQIANTYGIPLTLAVIPGLTGRTLADRLASEKLVSVVQHGYIHENHASPGQKNSEFPDNRPIEDMAADLHHGSDALTGFANREAVFVPPWNRITARLLPHLPGLGYEGLSASGPNPTGKPAPGLRQLNTHVDVIAWRTTRGFIGTKAAINAICGHLAERRLSQDCAGEPTGLLTHHLVHDKETWEFIDALFAFTQKYSKLQWLPVKRALNW